MNSFVSGLVPLFSSEGLGLSYFRGSLYGPLSLCVYIYIYIYISILSPSMRLSAEGLISYSLVSYSPGEEV